MPLPTISLRAAPEHHRIIRDIAAALRTHPDLIDVLQDVLRTQHGIASSNTDVLQSILDRLAALEELTAGMQPKTRQPKTRPGLRLSADKQKRIREMREQGKTRKQIAEELGVSTGTVSNYMKQTD